MNRTHKFLLLVLFVCIPAWATYTAPELATPSTGTIAFPTSSSAAAAVGSSYTASVPGYIWATTELSIASPGSTADSITLQFKQVANVPATPVTYTVVAPITAVNIDTGGVIISAVKIGPQVIFAEATDTVQVYGYDSLGLTWTYRVIFSDPSWTSGMTGNTVQTGDSYALIGSTGSGLTSLASAANQTTIINKLPASGTVPNTTTVMSANLTQILGAVLTGTAAYLAASFSGMHNVANPVFTTSSVNQSADAGPVAAEAASTVSGCGNLLLNVNVWTGPGKTGIPIANAHLKISASNNLAAAFAAGYTDLHGYYQFQGLTPGTYWVFIFAQDYTIPPISQAASVDGN